MDSAWSSRWAVITVATAGFLLFSFGGAIFASPLTLPLLYRIARRYPGRGLRITATVIGGLTCTQAAWAVCYLSFDDAMPWIWLLPLTAGVVWTFALLRWPARATMSG